MDTIARVNTILHPAYPIQHTYTVHQAGKLGIRKRFTGIQRFIKLSENGILGSFKDAVFFFCES